MVTEELERETRAKAGWAVRRVREAVETDNDIALALCERADLQLWLLREAARKLLAGDPEAVAGLTPAFGDGADRPD